MPMNLLKLCVGIESTDDLLQSMAFRLQRSRKLGRSPELFHTTRMIPKKREELLDGGSLYWVIKGNVQARQRLLDIRVFKDPEGVRRCNLIVDKELILTTWQPRRAFQGWRYLTFEDAPADLQQNDICDDLPAQMRQDLLELRLL